MPPLTADSDPSNIYRPAGRSLRGRPGGCVQVSAGLVGEGPHRQRTPAQEGPMASMSPSHQSSASGDSQCAAAGARFTESYCEELCPDQDISELVRRERAGPGQGLGP